MEIELVVIARLELQLYTQQRVMDGIADFKMTIGILGMSTENLLTDGVFIGNLANGTMIARFLQAADNLCLIQRIGCGDMSIQVANGIESCGHQMLMLQSNCAASQKAVFSGRGLGLQTMFLFHHGTARDNLAEPHSRP